MITFRDVAKSYAGGAFAVRDLNLEVARGETLALLGASGCGKTTTLKMVNRLIEPTSGTITVGDEDVTRADAVTLRRRIGYVFQGIGLFPHMTVAENVGIVPGLLGWSRDRIAARTDALLDLVRLPPDTYRDRYPRELSGGQRQRVGFARALAAGPEVLLMDEPFGALDPVTRDELQQEFVRLRDNLDLTVVLVTHDMTEALLLAHRIAVMQAGKILQIGTPHEMLTNPKDAYVAALMEMPRHQFEVLRHIAAGATA
jgi:osmoprotectant transport system ATP-binding protein